LSIAYFVLSLAVLPLAAANIPRPATDFNFRLPDGKQVSLQQYKGKVVVLEFLLTTCPHCLNTSRTMQKLYQQYASKGVQMLGVAINEGAERQLPAYIKEAGATFPVGVGNHDRAVDFLQHPIMLVLYVPQLVVIDESGTIVGQYSGTDPFFAKEEENLRAKIEELLK
jgi:peroxiredoxin